MPMTAIQGLQMLSQHPRSFLKESFVLVDQMPGASGVRTVKFKTSGFAGAANRYGTVLRSHSLKDAQDFIFSSTPGMGYDNTDVDVQFVQMYTYAGIGAINWYPLAGAGSSNIMITTKLTGCSFLVRDNAGVLECAHVQPDGAAVPPQTGQDLRQYLSTNHAGNYGALFGRGRTGLKGYEGTEAATVIGVRRANNWSIYAQRLVAGQSTFKDVERIWPR